jgi:hypothetical protein
VVFFLHRCGVNLDDYVPLQVGFCTISFQGRKETFQKFECFLELSRGGVGRNEGRGIFWVLS